MKIERIIEYYIFFQLVSGTVTGRNTATSYSSVRASNAGTPPRTTPPFYAHTTVNNTSDTGDTSNVTSADKDNSHTTSGIVTGSVHTNNVASSSGLVEYESTVKTNASASAGLSTDYTISSETSISASTLGSTKSPKINMTTAKVTPTKLSTNIASTGTTASTEATTLVTSSEVKTTEATTTVGSTEETTTVVSTEATTTEAKTTGPPTDTAATTASTEATTIVTSSEAITTKATTTVAPTEATTTETTTTVVPTDTTAIVTSTEARTIVSLTEATTTMTYTEATTTLETSEATTTEEITTEATTTERTTTRASTEATTTETRATVGPTKTTATVTSTEATTTVASTEESTSTMASAEESTATTEFATTKSSLTTNSSTTIDTVTISGTGVEFNEGQTTQLLCTVVPRTNDTITWSLDNGMLYNTSRRYILQDCTDDNCTSTLHITDISDIYDEGNYSCEANNQSSTMYALTVYQNPNITINPEWSSVPFATGMDIACTINNCDEINKASLGNFTWCPSDLSFSISYSDTCYFGIYTEVTDLNNSTISCGINECSENMTVNTYEYVHLQSWNGWRYEGDMTKLYCDISPPTNDTATWRMDGEIITMSTRRYLQHYCYSLYCQSILVITDASSMHDTGNYSCEVHNKTSGMFAVTISERPNITITPVWSSVLNGSTVNITCSIINCDKVAEYAVYDITWCAPGMIDTVIDKCTSEISTVATGSFTVSCGLRTCTQSASVHIINTVTISQMAIEANEGETTQLICTVTPRSDDNITWSLDGVTLYNTPRRYIIQDCNEDNCTSTLYITYISDAFDEGNYSCAVNNQSSAMCAVTVYQNPIVTISPQWSSILRGTRFNVTCSIRNCDEINKATVGNFVWCPSYYSGLISRWDNCTSAVYQDIYDPDNTTVSCGIQECTQNATVNTYDEVTISGHIGNAYEGEKIRLDCDTRPAISDKFTWRLNGTAITNSTRRYSDFNTCYSRWCMSILTINGVIGVYDVGNYSCEVNNQTSEVFPLSVYARPNVTISPQLASVLNGSYVNITCSIINCDEDDVWWERDRIKWCPQGMTKIQSDNCSSVISTLATETLTISCGFGETCTQSTSVHVYNIVKISGKATETNEGETVELVCTVTPRTDDMITWSLDDVTIHNTTRQYILQDCTEDNCTSTLYITDISDSLDEGNYSCALGNQSSEMYALTVYQHPNVSISPQWSSVLLGSTVNITCSIDNCDEINQTAMGNLTWCFSDLSFTILNYNTCTMKISAVVTDLNNSTISCGIQDCSENLTIIPYEIVKISGMVTETYEGEAIQLLCTVIPQTDENITWSLDGVALYNTSRRYILQDCTEDNCTSTLYITDIIDVIDEGNYSCSVNNQSSELHDLTVYQNPNITITPSVSAMLLGTSANITCHVNNCDEIDKAIAGNFTWCPPDIVYTIRRRNSCMMEISTVPKNMNISTISCGLQECSGNSSTLLPYVIVTMSGTDTSVHEGETTQMTCTVLPVTDDPITWSLNGATLQNTTRRYSLHTCHGGSCTSTLYITDVSDMDDEGIYRCNVNYQPSKAHNLTVYQHPNVTISPQWSSVLLGSSVNVICSINNCGEIGMISAENITWCPYELEFTVLRNDTCEMEISTVMANLNNSTISCGIQQCSQNMTVMTYEKVTLSGTVTETYEGESTRLMCTVTPRTDDIITWSLDGVTIYNTSRRYILQDCTEDNCTSTLYITDISDKYDEGNYSCAVHNQTSSNYALTVYQIPVITISSQWSSVLLGSSVNITCSINNCDKINRMTVGNFTWCPSDLVFSTLKTDTCMMEITTAVTDLGNHTFFCGIQECSQNVTINTYEIVTLSGEVTEIYEEETTQLTCTIITRTNDIITWSLDGVTLYNTSRRYFLQDCSEDICTSTLYIMDISDVIDEGNYTCAANNQSSKMYGLTVYQNPDVTISPQWSSVTLGSTVNITCNMNNCDEINQATMGNFTWCPADLAFSTVNSEVCSMVISTNATVLNNSTISCGIRKCSQNMTVNAFELAPGYSLSISANTSSPVEGEAVRLTCSVTPRTDSISWTQDGITLSNSTRRNFIQKCSGTTCTSKLYLQNILAMTDTGNYSCKVNNQLSEVYMMTVYQKPTITIRPEPTPVMMNETLNVTCSISNCDKIDKRVVGNFIWRINDSSGLPYTTIQNSTCKMKISVKVTSVKLPGANSYKTSCSIGIYSASSTINVYKPAPNACPTKKENEITWYKTNAKTTVTQDCPEGYVGKATRRCNNQGQWDIADIWDCESEKLHEVTQTLQKLGKTKIDAAGLNNVLTSVNNFVTADLSGGGGTDNADLQENNVVKTAKILKSISSAKFDIMGAKQANETAQNFIGIAANLLNNNKTEKLKGENQKKDTATNLIESIDNLGKKLSEAIHENETISITKSNIVMLIQKVKPKKVQFPDPEKSDKISEDTTKLTLDEETLKKLDKGKNGIVFTAVKYTSLASLLDSFSSTNSSTNITVNSDVLSLSIHGLDTNFLDPPVNFVFQNSQRSPSGHTLNCSFLNLNTSEWSSEGCAKIKSDNENKTNCSCTHLTNFAILMSPGESVSEEEYERLRFISLVGCSLSIAGGVLTIAVYLHFWRYVKNRRSVLVVNLCFAMSSAYLVFLVAVEHNENKVACIAIAALLHYLFLSMFCLMLSIGIDLAIAILHVYKSRSKSASLLLLGWGAPVVIVGITMASTQLKDYGDDRFCWLRNDTLYGFIVPVLAIITINILIVIAVMRRMYSTSFMLKKSKKQKAISGVRSMAALLPVLGLTWIFGVLSVASKYVIFQYLFSIFNSVQKIYCLKSDCEFSSGLFVFIFHCVFNISIRKAFRNSVRKFDLRNNSSFQKTSKEKLTSKSSNDFKGHSDEMADADLNLKQDPPKSVYAIPRSKVVIGNRHRPREDRGNFSRFSDNSSFYSQRNTHL